MANSFQVTFDANDPAKLADFWGMALGYVIQPPPEGFDHWDDWARSMGIPEENWNDARALVDPDGVGPRIFFQRVPEGKTAKNRVHMDVNVGGGHENSLEERRAIVKAVSKQLIAEGATKVEVHEYPDRNDYWIVMLDPEDNEFCVQ